MDVYLRGRAPGFGVTLQEVLWLFFPEAKVCEHELEPNEPRLNSFFENQSNDEPSTDGSFVMNKPETGEATAWLIFEERCEPSGVVIKASFHLDGKVGQGKANLHLTVPEEEENDRRRVSKLALLRALEDYTGKLTNQWGILTGVRPTKIVHRRLDKDAPLDTIAHELTRDYAVHPDKTSLLIDIAQRQRPFFYQGPEDRNRVGVYIGIPFCPTRCLYCSFPGYELKKYKKWVEPFWSSLLLEVEQVGKALTQAGQQVEHIYVGGGTPTSLNPEMLEGLLQHVQEHICSRETIEFTVEAGRPDTLDQTKLEVMLARGVNRLSINPQSMNASTLERIGRCHRPEEVEKTVALAKKMGFPIINMDVIIGLPGETAATVTETMERIAALQPENVTVHTMAFKRASRLTAEKGQWVLPPEEEVAAMLEVTKEAARKLEMVPYYMYRQKRILANMENVGYALPGTECIYNIQVMEERQTIWGIGAGAATKIIRPEDAVMLDSWHNPKDPMNYVERIQEIIRRKTEQLEGKTC
ncbi:coproporphyrinogen dehydrogenase HemZ [Heliobacillus mobilis]|uniref:Coproporphyrinogen dehydrogenase HemZ n=1 Tax=Heliobacterium mobile TaxID=28064 RepID=A0A6I3SLC8_HELMO|nr:coproporphyrinogen dehydrogenase HemZ [Heliobacterium mobile]MTV49720.1 coproporphyrinogen dehydrogenase HemZ [Heliobacterium mobile]